MLSKINPFFFSSDNGGSIFAHFAEGFAVTGELTNDRIRVCFCFDVKYGVQDNVGHLRWRLSLEVSAEFHEEILRLCV